MAMGRSKCLVLVLAAILPSACTSTKLEVTLHGGFGYVIDSDFAIEAGFMKSIDEGAGGCQVKQLGVELKIDDGKITSPPNQAATIPITDAVVTFEGTGNSAVTLDGELAPHYKTAASGSAGASASAMSAISRRGPSGVTQPSPPRTSESQWSDLYWLPHTRLDYWDSDLDPNWRTSAVTGRLKLTGGSLSAGLPSDGAALNGLWEFRSASGRPTHQQAITDRLHYKANVSGTSITIDVQRGSTVTKYVVEPIDSRKTVGLIVVGRHGDVMPIGLGDPLAHFCTFYQMLRADRRPAQADRLIPYFIGTGVVQAGASTVPANGQPSPGAYCPGDWP
jgi:hypothetical protein